LDGRKSNSLGIVWCILLALPALIPLAMHFWFAQSAGHQATGFIQNDQPYYMANARELFDAENFSLTYKNPNDWRAESPKIYFQPQTLLLGIIQKTTGLDPALIFNLFGFIFAVLTVRVAWSLLNEFLPEKANSKAVFLTFLWGGGLFAISGLIAGVFLQEPAPDIYDRLTMFDPFQGWWFLNLGRNLVFPLEAYYHFLFLSGMLMACRGKQFAAVAIGLLISISHPFTGVEYLAILTASLFLERLFWPRASTSWAAAIASAGLFVLHVGYYQIWLNRFPTHRELHEVWELAWELDAIPMLLGYGLVALFAIWGLRSFGRAQEFIKHGHNRLALVWFVVAFLLANHELFMKPIQPLHFTRGYVWTPVFLTGAAALHGFLKYINQKSGMLILLVMALFLMDNATWLCVCQIDGRHNSAHSETDIRAVMKVLDETAEEKAVVVSNSRLLSYMSTVYTKHDAFVGHGYLTPNTDENWKKAQALFEEGQPIDVLANYPQLILLEFAGKGNWDLERIQRVYEESGFTLANKAQTESYGILHCVPADRH